LQVNHLLILLKRIHMSLTHKFTIIIPPQDISCQPGILEKLANGDREAFAWIYKNYSKKIYDYAFLMTGNEVMSEDVVQETFLKLWKHREKLASIENFNSYLYILYRNYIMDVIKDQKKEISAREAYCRDAKLSDIITDEIIDHKQTQELVAKVVKQLPPQQQMVYKLSREYGWKRHRIAKELRLSPFTVKKHLQLSLKFLKKKITE